MILAGILDRVRVRVRVTGVRVTGVRVTGVRVTGVRVTGVRVRVTGVRVTGVRVTGVRVRVRVRVTWPFGAGPRRRFELSPGRRCRRLSCVEVGAGWD